MESTTVINPYRSIFWSDYETLNYQFYLNTISTVIGFLFLLPIRLVILFLVLSSGWILIEIIFFFFSTKENLSKDELYKKITTEVQEKPKIKSWVRKLSFYIIYWAWRTLLWCAGVYWIEVKNSKNLDKNCRIVAYGPHTSLIDGPPLCVMSGRPWTGLSSISNYHMPLSGRFLRLLEFTFVDNDCSKSRKTAIETIKLRTTSDDWKECVSLFSPEGTTSNGTNLGQFKQGIFLPGQPIQGFVAEFPEWFDRISGNITDQRRNTRGCGWIGYTWDSSILYLVIYHLCCIWQPCIVTVLPPYYPSEEEKTDTDLFITNFRQKFTKASGLSSFNTNRLDAAIVGSIFKNFKSKAKDPKTGKLKNANMSQADQFLIYGGDLEAKFGSRMVKNKEVVGWFDEWLVGDRGQSLVDFISEKVEMKIGKNN